jgi:hypothetical protein
MMIICKLKEKTSTFGISLTKTNELRDKKYKITRGKDFMNFSFINLKLNIVI